MKAVIFALAASLALAVSPAVALEAGPAGVWTLPKQKLTVQVRYCGADRICAVIAGLKKPLDNKGRPKVDKKNPNPALRSRPLMGLEIITGMKAAGENKWKGLIYNADDGTTYRATARLTGDTFQVEGCWGPFCKKMNFKRAATVATN